ncbi:MAG: ABC transporter substrate-binding protein [Myxococcales bacterium]|nr:ABC transporter substrate-binding protein [Myxococcales bacterium]
MARRAQAMTRLSTAPLIAAVAFASLGLGPLGCNGDNGNKGGSGDGPAAGSNTKIYNWVRSSAHKSLDPVDQFDSASAELISNVYDTLLQYHYLKRPYQLEPNLVVAMPTLSDDGLSYSFELRKDVRFIDDPCFKGGKGRALVSDDVIYSIKRFADANLNGKSYVLMQGVVEGMDAFREETKKLGKAVDYAKLEISGLKKIDDQRFEMRLTRKNSLALMPLAASQLSIVPREAVEHYKDEFQRRPVGSGPFKLATLSRRGVTILKKNENYHQSYPTEGEPDDQQKGLLAAAGQKLPFVDEVHLPLIEEPQPRMLKFKRGQLDVVGIDKDNFTQMAFRDDKGFHLKPDYASKFNIASEPMLVTQYFVFNLSDPLLGKNRALRQAIAYALDTKGYIDQMLNGRGVALKTIVPLPIAGSERDVKATWYTQNLELAKQKLVEAGYPEGKGLPEITIEYRHSSSQTRQSFEYHRAQLAKVGITIKGNFQTFSAFLQRIDAGNFQMSDSGWQADYPDAENFYQLLYGPNKSPGPNASGYNNPEFDKLYEQSRFMESGPERWAIFERMSEMIREDVPIVFTVSNIAVGLSQRWVKNRKQHMMIDLPAKYYDIDVAAKTKGL